MEMGTIPKRSAVDFRQFLCGYDICLNGSVCLSFITVGEVSLRNYCICFIYILDKECQSHAWIFLENDINSYF